MKFLTIVIPSYQVDKYIESTLESFLSPEIIDDIEILVVNDGSTDKTEEISKTYEARYPNSIRVITKENGGHGSTINRGIQEAKGLFFKVVDGDDWVETDGLLQLIQLIKTTDSDMIINPFFRVNDQNGEKELVSYTEISRYNETSFEEIERKSDRYYMHSITYRTAVLQDNNIHIDEKLFYVDMEYILFPIPYIEKVCFMEVPVYNYRIFTAHQSMAKVNIIKRREQHKRVLHSLIKWFSGFKHLSAEKRNYILHNLAMMAMQHYKIILNREISKEAKNELFAFDAELKLLSKEVYDACYGRNMWALRKFGKMFYPLFAKIVQQGELY